MVNVSIVGLGTPVQNISNKGFRIPFIPGGDLLEPIIGFIFGLVDLFLKTTGFIIWFFSFIFNAGIFWFGHITILMMFIEIFLIGVSIMMGGVNPIKIISSFISLHFQIIYIFFMLTYYLIMLIYQGIIALTTWIP